VSVGAAAGRRLLHAPGAAAAGAALALLLAWLVVYPLVLVLLEGVREQDAWTLEYVREFLARKSEWSALWGSLWISLASVALSALIGVPLALLFGRYDFPGRRLMGALVALPAVLPPLVGVVSFLFLYGESGFAAHVVMRLFDLERAPWQLKGPVAILLVHAYSMFVYFYLFTRAGLAGLGGEVFEAAASLGAGRWRTFTRVTLPLLRPSLTAAALLTFMTSLASFSAPYVFGGGFRVMPTQIVSTRLNGDESLAMVETARSRCWRCWRSRSSASRSAPSPAAARARRRRRCACAAPGRAPSSPSVQASSPSCSCCRTPRSCWCRWCRSAPGPRSRCRRSTPSPTTARSSPIRCVCAPS